MLAVGLIDPNSVRAEGEDKQGVIYGLPFLRDIGMGTSKVKLGARVAVIGGGNTAIDCAREALRQGAVEVTMITVESNPEEMPCRAGRSARHARRRRGTVARPRHDGGAGQRQGRSAAAASGAVLRRDQCFADQHRSRGAAGASFAVDNVIIAVGQHASLAWLPAEFKNERGNHQDGPLRPSRRHELLCGRRHRAGGFGAAVDGGERRRRRQARRVQSGQGAARRCRCEPRSIPVDVIFDLNRMNMTYFPHFPRVQQDIAAADSRKKTQEEVIQAYTEEQAVEEASRCFSCGTCNACDNCYLVCPEPCIVRDERSNGLYKILVDYCKGCRVCIEECPTGCLEGVPELDFDTGVVRMDTAFAISPGLHGRQAEELRHLADRAGEKYLGGLIGIRARKT